MNLLPRACCPVRPAHLHNVWHRKSVALTMARAQARRYASAPALPKTFTMRAPKGETVEIPSVGFGTWASGGPNQPASGEWVKKAVADALKAGYRHLDCAWYYGVDEEIGEAIHASGIPRSEIFVTSKIWNNFLSPAAIPIALDKILEGMKLDYVDLLLAHWPCAFKPTSFEDLKGATARPGSSMKERGIELGEDGNEIIDWENTSTAIAEVAGHPEGSFVPTWLAMKELAKGGKVRAIGVSNFGIKDLETLLPHADPNDVPISCNQVEVHPWLPNKDLIQFGKENGILTSCYSPFAGQKKDGSTLIKDPTVKALASETGMDIGQLLQSWAVQRGTIPLGKSQNAEVDKSAERIRTNLDVRQLSAEATKALDDLAIPNGQGRTIDFTDVWGVKLYQN